MSALLLSRFGIALRFACCALSGQVLAQVTEFTFDNSGNLSARKIVLLGVPQLISQPQIQVVTPGELASFIVVVANSFGATYQWRFNASNIPGATGDALLLTNVSAANEGQYSVVVTSSAGSVTSAPAMLMMDGDGDGLPDSWEITYFNTITFQRGGGDADGDGISNLDEFYDGTNPNDSASVRHRLTILSDGGSVAAVPTQLTYSNGEPVTLTATPFPPNAFYGWSGDLTTRSNPASLTMNTNKLVRARFDCLPPPPGSVAFWRGEMDASDQIAGHNGTFYNGGSPTGSSLTTTGKVGGAFVFDAAVHVRVPDSADLRPSEITLEAWVYPYPGAPSGFQTVMARGSSTGTDGAWWLEVFNGTARFWTKHAGSGMDVIQMNGVIPMNQWSHLAATFDGTTKRLYVNGAAIAEIHGRSALAYDPAVVPTTIGANWMNNGPAQGFYGRIDEASVYNRALQPQEISSIYLADFAGKCLNRPVITTSAHFPSGAPGIGYTQQVTAVLGAAPITFSLSAGTMPPGLMFSNGGLVSGIPTTAGTYVFAVLATDAGGFATEQICELQILPAVSPPGLIAWWRAENDAQDAARTNHGILRNGATFISGQVGQGFAFDGVDDFVEIPDAPELQPASLTFEAWVKLNVTNGIHVIAAKPLGTGFLDSFALFMVDGSLSAVRADLLGDGPYLSKSFAPEVGRWYHMAYTFDDPSKQQALYIDGVQVARGTATRSIGYDGHPVLLGCDVESGTLSYFLNGSIDEASFYNRALAEAEIASIYNAGSFGKSRVGPYINGPSVLPPGIVAQSYGQTFTSIRGTPPLLFSPSAGTLPPGLSLNAAGMLAGTPTAAGHFEFIVRATDSTGLFTEQQRSIQILPSATPAPGLIAWWSAEHDALDSAGTNHGLLKNGAGFAGGRVGQAFAFDGINDSVDIPDSPLLRPASFTLEAWVKFNTISGTRHIFAKPLGGGNLDSFGLFLGDNALRGIVSDLNGAAPALVAPTTLLTGRWYHLAYTFDDGSKQQVLYVDGSQVASGTANKTIAYDSQPVLLGRDIEFGNPSFFLQGSMDEAAIYYRALSAAEVASNYSNGAAGPYFDLSAVLPDGLSNSGYTQTLSAIQGQVPITYQLVGSQFPPGLSMNATGLLAGVPTNVGIFSFVIRATDNAGRYGEQLFTLQVFQQLLPPTGLAGWWRAESDATDAAGTNTGALVNGTGFSGGRVGQAFAFDGINDSVDIPDSPALRPASLTVEAWVAFYGTSGISRNTIWAKPVGPTGPRESFTLYLETGNVLRGAVGDATGMANPVSTPFTPVLGRWYHLAYTFDDTSKQQTLYVDGIQVAASVENRSVGYDAQPLLLGRDFVSGPGSFYFFQGRIDEAALYNRALTGAEIGSLFAMGSLGKRPLTNYERWKLAHLNDPGAADLGDPDDDGYATLFEYGLNLQPEHPDPTGLPQVSLHDYLNQGKRLRAVVQRDPTHNDVNIEIQGANSLSGPWETLAVSTQGGPFQGTGYVGGDGLGSEIKTVEIRDSSNTTNAAIRFLKITVMH